MPITDSAELRVLLNGFFPSLEIEKNLRKSGQRLVYFCKFGSASPVESQIDWAEWGNVVLKVSEGIDPAVIARMETEREILNSLNSIQFPRQHYCDVFSIDPITELPLPSRLFVSIEQRVQGEALSDCRDSFRSEGSVRELLIGLVSALTLLWEHPKRIIHRDLKPDNILILADGTPVIIDLGIAREQGSPGVTSTGFMIGPCTPAYASPEQIRNQKLIITYKADFFALGVIAYELLSGSNPFMESAADSIHVVLDRAQNYTPPSLASMSLASPAFSDLVQKLMAKQPYMRPRTIPDVRNALSALRGE